MLVPHPFEALGRESNRNVPIKGDPKNALLAGRDLRLLWRAQLPEPALPLRALGETGLVGGDAPAPSPPTVDAKVFCKAFNLRVFCPKEKCLHPLWADGSSILLYRGL